MPTLTLAIQPFATGSPQASRRTLLDLARAVDEAGVDRILVVDHVVMAEETASYPWGSFPATADTPWPEPTISLAAVAAVTERVRLATGILIAPLRPAALLAKTIATLDVISGGRVDLGVGTGWQEGEFAAVGVPFRQRGRLLTETIGACRALWSTGPANYHGELISFDGVWCRPQPAQARIPVWFSGLLGQRNLERIASVGDGWLPPPNATPEVVAALIPALMDAWERAGRGSTPPAVQMRVTPAASGGNVDLTATMAEASRVVGLGATDVRISFDQLRLDPGRVAGDLSRLANAFRDTVG